MSGRWIGIKSQHWGDLDQLKMHLLHLNPTWPWPSVCIIKHWQRHSFVYVICLLIHILRVNVYYLKKFLFFFTYNLTRLTHLFHGCALILKKVLYATTKSWNKSRCFKVESWSLANSCWPLCSNSAKST